MFDPLHPPSSPSIFESAGMGVAIPRMLEMRMLAQDTIARLPKGASDCVRVRQVKFACLFRFRARRFRG